MKTGVLLAGRYQLDQPIAAGGMGQVWRATDRVLGRQVAVKLLRPEYADQPETLSRFRSEARHAASVTHACIAQVYDYGDTCSCGSPYLVMELVDGPSLYTVLTDGPLSPVYAVDLTGQVASGLAAAHRAGLVHRDIKPANLLLGPDGQVKITDFGIAHVAGSTSVTDPKMIMGTSQYLAPERIVGGPGGPASDLYSLGIVLHECLTGAPPFAGSPAEVMASHLHRPLPPLQREVPPEVRVLAARLTVKDPGQRLADAGELAAVAHELHAALADGEQDAMPAADAGGSTVHLSPLPASRKRHLVSRRRVPRRRVPGSASRRVKAALAAGASVPALLADAVRPAVERPTRRTHRPGRPGVLSAAVLVVLVALGLGGWAVLDSGNPGHQQDESAALSTSHSAAPSRTATSSASATPSRTATPATAPPAVRLTPAKATAFGPAGTSDGDNASKAGDALRAGTGWQSQWYMTATFGNLKKGTGLLVDMGSVVSITSVSAQLGQSPGAAVQLAVGDKPVMSALHTVQRVTNAGKQAVLRFPAVKARYILIWYTTLPSDGSGTYQADIAGIRVQGYR